MVPPIRLYFSIPLMRRFCKVPGEIFRISRTSGDLSQGLGNSEDDLFFLLVFLIKTSDITGERLWLLDEGHCFRDQLIRFCQMESVKLNQMAYKLGSLETFMRMVESGKGITFIPELAMLQLGEKQKELVRSFAVPRPTRQIVVVTKKSFIRHSILDVLRKEILAAVPKEMLNLQALQYIV